MSEKKTQLKSEPGQNEERGSLISKQILSQLGRPSDLISVQVRWLWNDHCRVNVIVGNPHPRVGHSFFLSVAEDGAILEATPHVEREYPESTPIGPSGAVEKVSMA